MSNRGNHAWAGTVGVMVESAVDGMIASLRAFVADASPEQVSAWRGELAILQREGAVMIHHEPASSSDATVLEYQLPREAGRRPDVILLRPGILVVLEFKATAQMRRADLDQVHAYARDLRDYHEHGHALRILPVLVLAGAVGFKREVDGVHAVSADLLAAFLTGLSRNASPSQPSLQQFLEGEYAPLPTLVAAARLLFQNLSLPQIRRARSAGVDQTVHHILQGVKRAREERRRQLVLVTGVPGAGKTLVGLQVAHAAALEEGFRIGSRRTRGSPATFLSGNGPLVQVLQNALKSTAFVQDMHRYIREYGIERTDRQPWERVIVFDEAQRAWDRAKLGEFYEKRNLIEAGSARSEPELLLDIAGRVDGWAMVVALVGEGQAIHTGEEAGLPGWIEAVRGARDRWEVEAPPAVAALFEAGGLTVVTNQALGLDRSLRTQGAEYLHLWIQAVLDRGDPDAARPLADSLRRDGFPIYVTRDLNAAKDYVRQRFAGESDRRFGLLTSSKARNLVSYGIDIDFQTMKRLKVDAWFNDNPESLRSSCQLAAAVTEFQCQGLELDLPIVCWGDDLYWQRGSGRWARRPERRAQPAIRDPDALRRNAYRVLLSRGREGLVIFVPQAPSESMNDTAAFLESAGARTASAQLGAA